MKRRRIFIVQFDTNPVSGELLGLDNLGNMWSGGRQSIDGRTHIAWQKIGGLPYDEADVDEATAEEPEYTSPAALPRFGNDD